MAEQKIEEQSAAPDPGGISVFWSLRPASELGRSRCRQAVNLAKIPGGKCLQPRSQGGKLQRSKTGGH
jgi:hypothetical protein